MTQLPSAAPPTKFFDSETVTRTIPIGEGFRLPPEEVADGGRVRVGGGYRLPTA
jgi:hypothetical protein